MTLPMHAEFEEFIDDNVIEMLVSQTEGLSYEWLMLLEKEQVGNTGETKQTT